MNENFIKKIRKFLIAVHEKSGNLSYKLCHT